MEFFIFDTNTLLSALLNENSTPGLALKQARRTGILLISDEVISEYLVVFSREKFNKWLSLKTRIDFIENIVATALPVRVVTHVSICRDPKDNKYLSLAKTSGADCIISGDQDLLVLNPFEHTQILNAADFLQAFN